PSEPPASTQEVSESEVPVHVPLRRPRPFRFERLRVPVWNPYSRGRLGPAKSEDPKGGEGKADANLTNFLSTDAAGWHPNSPPRPGGGAPHPAPSARKSVIRLHRKLPSEPPASTQEVSESENRQQLGAQPTPRFRGCSMHCSMHCSTHCRPSLFAAHRR